MKVSHRITRLATAGLASSRSPPPPRAPGRRRPDTPGDRSSARARPSCRASTTGFDWASAAIGAGIAGGLILLLGWGGVTYRHRHEHIGVAH